MTVPDLFDQEGRRYIEDENGNRVAVDATGHLSIDGDVNVTNASIPITHTGDLDVNVTNATIDVSGSTVSFPSAQSVQFDSAQSVSAVFPSAQDININGATVEVGNVPTIAKGEDMSSLLATDTYTTDIHATNITGTIYDLIDADSTTFLKFAGGFGDNVTSSALVILDLGADLLIHNLAVKGELTTLSIGAGEYASGALWYSSNKVDWTRIADTGTTASLTTIPIDWTGIDLTFRYLRLIAEVNDEDVNYVKINKIFLGK